MSILNKKLILTISFTFTIIFIFYAYLFEYFRSNSSINLKKSLSDVNLKTHEGELAKNIMLNDIPILLFFGFTNCPEVCPTTLSTLINIIKKSNTNNSNYKIIFVTLDPSRDTQKSLARYIEIFDDNIIGLTGKISEIDKFAKKWNVYWEKVDNGKDDYTINHTATVFMLNSKGDFAGTISWIEDEKSIEIKLNKLFSS